MDKIDLVKEELWDHYSGLPNPAWYQQLYNEDDEKNNTNTNINTEFIPSKI